MLPTIIRLMLRHADLVELQCWVDIADHREPANVEPDMDAIRRLVRWRLLKRYELAPTELGKAVVEGWRR